MSTDAEIDKVSREIFDLLQTLSSPRAAAHALCSANVLLIERDSDRPKALRDVQNMAGEMSVQIIAQWMMRHAAAAAN
jgi:hypothetical protein